MSTIEHALSGCRPVPLSSYLKGLGVLRIVAEQADPDARGCFPDGRFHLSTALDVDALLSLFLHDYRPSPILAPWNGGSGFYEKDRRDAIEKIEASSGSRLSDYRTAIAAGRLQLERLGIGPRPDKAKKDALLRRCRNTFPDAALGWLDAALVLTSDGPKYPPLLGTGGNDGRLDFTNNFMQRLLDVVDPETGSPRERAEESLRSALFDEPTDAGADTAIGQFHPSAAGGANASSEPTSRAIVNPWDFVLMIEGSLYFSAAAVRRLEASSGGWAYPFTVRSAHVGYGSAVEDEPSHGEIWLPLWERPASSREVGALFSEGRARVGRRAARDGVDFARAVATLGVDRGIAEFQRYGFHLRNGRSHLATPLERMPVLRVEEATLIDEVDPWLDRLDRALRSRGAPGAVTRARREVAGRISDLCRRGDRTRVRELLVALGALEAALGRRLRFTEASGVMPCPLLSDRWLEAAYDGTAEFRLALSLARCGGRYRSDGGPPRWVSLRENLEPVRIHGRGEQRHARFTNGDSRDVVPDTRDLVGWLTSTMARRILLAQRGGEENAWSERGACRVPLADVTRFLRGEVSDAGIRSLFRGLALLRFEGGDFAPAGRGGDERPTALYALLKLCFPGGRPAHERDALGPKGSEMGLLDLIHDIPLAPAVLRLAAAGDALSASREAVRRLRGSGLAPAIGAVAEAPVAAQRAAAALMFPLRHRDLLVLARRVLRSTETRHESA